MKKILQDLLVCPKCGNSLKVKSFCRNGEQIVEGELSCNCGMTFPIINSIPRILLDTSKNDSKLFKKLERKTQESFSYQWTSFSQMSCDFRDNFLNYILIMFVSVVPDLDIVPGFIAGFPSKYHHGITHSFFSAIVFGFLLSWLIYLLKKNHFLSRAVLFSALYSLHIILDLFTIDTGWVNGFGMPIFFPFTLNYYRSSVVLFKVGLMNYGFTNFQVIFNYNNFIPFTIEFSFTLLIGVSIILMGMFIKKIRLF